MRIQHNIMAMNAYRNYNTNTSALSKNLEKLSSGYKINRAGDDAAGLAISEKMRAQITGLNAAQKNVKDGISLVKTGEGAMQEIQDMLNRMDYLATQSANGTYDNDVDRANLQKEVDALKTEINRIADSANFNGIKLLDGSLSKTGKASSANFDGWDSIKGSLAAGITDVAATASTSKLNLAKQAGTAVDIDEGSTISFTIGMSDGKSYEFTATAKLDATDNTKYIWVDQDGNELTDPKALTGAKGTDAEIGGVIEKLVANSELGETFNVKYDTNTLTLTAKEKGAGPAIVTSVDMTAAKSDGTTMLLASNAAEGRAAVDATTKAGEDAYQALDLSKALVLDHKIDKTSLEKATFEINGEKFVFVEKGAVTDENIAKMKEAGIEHWVELGTASANAGDGPKNTDIAEMVKKIKHATGLDVEAGKVDAGAWSVSATATENTFIRIKDGAGTKEGGGLTLQLGDTPDEYNQMKVFVGDMHTKALGIADLNISNQEGAAAAIETIRNAINNVSSVRGDLGAVQNRLEHTANNLSVMAENIQDAESTIRDTDVAEEMMAYTKNNILIQSAQAMLAQANAVPQGVLQLLG